MSGADTQEEGMTGMAGGVSVGERAVLNGMGDLVSACTGNSPVIDVLEERKWYAAGWGTLFPPLLEPLGITANGREVLKRASVRAVPCACLD